MVLIITHCSIFEHIINIQQQGMKNKLILFNLDGVLLNSRRNMKLSWNKSKQLIFNLNTSDLVIKELKTQ